VRFEAKDGVWTASAKDGLIYQFDAASGRLAKVTRKGDLIEFSNGPRLVGADAAAPAATTSHRMMADGSFKIDAASVGPLKSFSWTVHPDGALDLRGLMLSKLKVKTNEAGEETLAGPAISMGEDARPGQIVHADEHGEEGAQARTKKVWTVSALRQLIAEQGGRAPPAAEVGEGHTAALQAGQPVAAPTGSLSPGSTGAEQVGEFRSNGPPQESESSRGVYLKFGAALLAGLGLVAYLFRKTG
jgi:hypothetical protein